VKDITDNYLQLEEFEYENVNRASKACGPLAKWVVSQLGYSQILKKVCCFSLLFSLCRRGTIHLASFLTLVMDDPGANLA